MEKSKELYMETEQLTNSEKSCLEIQTKLNDMPDKMGKSKLTKAIIQVMKEVRGMEKNSRVGSGGNAYNGTKDQDVKEVFNDALSKNGLCIIPTDIDANERVERWEQTYNGNVQQKQSIFTTVRTKYLLLHDSGESIELAGYGHGIDPQDKGAGKATTYALKNCLLYTFLTPVGKIDDSDNTHSDDIKTPEKPSLNEGTKEFKSAIEYLEGPGTIKEIEQKYKLSKKVKEALTTL